MKDRIRILLVEDDEDDYIITRDLIAEISIWRGELDWLRDPEAALRKMLANEYDVYLLDYHLGSKTGLDLLKEAIQGGCTAPVILLTGREDQDVDVEAMRHGASDYLVKGEITSQMIERSIRYSIKHKESEAEKDRLIEELKEAMNRIKTLSGLIPICASCKKIRDDRGYWQQVEAFIQEHTEAEFSHGICPDCAKRLYPAYYRAE
ncbi:MAG TPA: response regulator [Nitrospirae bacterium]|nr:response regulator [Nitrospirota bacterium]